MVLRAKGHTRQSATREPGARGAQRWRRRVHQRLRFKSSRKQKKKGAITAGEKRPLLPPSTTPRVRSSSRQGGESAGLSDAHSRPNRVGECAAIHTMQPPGVRPPDFNSLINGLLATDAPLPRRLQTASTLRTVLCAPEHAALVQRDSGQLLNALEQLLYDRAEPIRRQGPVLISALAAAMRPNLHQFISWLLYTAQCATQNQQNQTLSPLVLLVMHEALEALVQARDTPCVLPYLPDLVRCAQVCHAELEPRTNRPDWQAGPDWQGRPGQHKPGRC